MSSFTVLSILIAIFLLLVGTAIFLYLVVRRSRKIAFAADPTMKPDDKTKKDSGVEFLQYASDSELRASFRRALRILKTYVTGHDYRYRAPWYLIAGEAKSGKTALLESNGLNESVNELVDESGRKLNWYFFDEGVIIDVAGDFVLRSDGTANHRGWNTILRLLQKHRPQRPLDGLVLTIPAGSLAGSGELDHQRRYELEQRATCLYKKLWQAQKILGMRLPIYVVVTKCDEITGFSSFCNQLPERLHSQMFGWSNPSTLDTAYKTEFVTQAFESLHKRLSWLQFEVYAERDEIENADELFLLPPQMQTMREPLRVYLDTLFKQSAYHEPYLFRGVYFCGDVPVETDALLQIDPVDEWPDQDAELQLSSKPIARRPVFLSDLFREKIFREAALAQPIRRIALSRNRMVLAAQVFSLLIVLLGGTGLVISHARLAKQEDELYRFLLEEENDLRKMETYYADPRRTSAADATTREELLNRKGQILEGGQTRLISGMAHMSSRKFASVFIPTSWFGGINERLEHSVAAAFKYVIFESLRLDMQRRGRDLLTAHPRHASEVVAQAASNEPDPAMADDDQNGRSQSHVDPSFQLSIYVEELGEYRVNLE